MKSSFLFDRGDRLRVSVDGEKAVEVVNGLVSNDVASLQPGAGLYAAALTPRGKIVADVRVFARAGSVLLDSSARAAAGLAEMLRKYINPRLARFEDVSATLRDVGVFGSGAAEVVARSTGVGEDVLARLGPYSHISHPLRDGAEMIIARVPDLAVEGFDILIPADAEQGVRERVLAAGAAAGDAELWRSRRVAIGWPEWGLDMDESTLPQEANLDELHAISYTKGCYVGQETVARIHFRGHVNRHLRRLSVDGDALPPAGAELLEGSGRAVGDTRSAARAAGAAAGAAAGVIALGMVRREVDSGAALAVRWDGGSAQARVLGRAVGKAEGAAD